jgi:Putative Ig domain
VLRIPIGNLSDSSSSSLHGVLAVAQPSPSPSTVSSDSASALPTWLLVALYALVVLIVVAMFALTAYNLTSAGSTLRRIIRRGKKGPPSPETLNSPLVRTLAKSAQAGTRTTRTTLAIVGFSLLGVAVVAVFGLSGQGVRDLRNQVIGAVTTLVAAIAGFYFGARTAESSASGPGATTVPPGLAPPDPKNPNPGFTVGQAGTYTPVLTGTPPPTVSLSVGTLPSGLTLDPSTGVITGTSDPGTAGSYPITLTASNGISPDAAMTVTLGVTDPSAAPV